MILFWKGFIPFDAACSETVAFYRQILLRNMMPKVPGLSRRLPLLPGHSTSENWILTPSGKSPRPERTPVPHPIGGTHCAQVCRCPEEIDAENVTPKAVRSGVEIRSCSLRRHAGGTRATHARALQPHLRNNLKEHSLLVSAAHQSCAVKLVVVERQTGDGIISVGVGELVDDCLHPRRRSA